MQVHLLIFGFVQGVGYRQFVKKNAERLGLTGWVQNLPDGSVEIVLQGEKKILENMILLCRKGPFLADVEDVQVKWEEDGEEYKEFTILPS